MSSLFNIILYRPILNLFIGLYNVIPGHDLGVVILVITILVRIVLWPLNNSAIKAQKNLQELQPKLDAIRKQFPTDKQKQAEATMALYKETKINPLASCLPLVIQIPILLALFWVMRDSLSAKNIASNLYPFVQDPGTLKGISFGFLDLSSRNVVLAVLAGAAQFVQAKMMSRKPAPKEAGAGAKDEDMTAAMNKQMLYFMPVMTVIIGFQLPAGLALYWFFSTLLMAGQQWVVFRKHPPTAPAVK